MTYLTAQSDLFDDATTATTHTSTLRCTNAARAIQHICVLLMLSLAALLLSGCNHKPKSERVYVSARQAFLRDRVAAVSNRVAEVANGQPLDVVEHGKRFLKVKTEKNEIGWIEEHSVVDQKLFEGFEKLAEDHKNDPVVSTAITRDDLYLHVRPGRETDHLYLLAGNIKVQLLKRAVVPKTGPGIPVARPVTPAPTTPTAPATTNTSNTTKPAPAATKPAAKPTTLPTVQPADTILEDWWLARDSAGHTGWLLQSRVDVDVPDEIGTFAEGQRIVGSYLLAKVTDPKSNTPNNQVAEYVTLMGPAKQGQPYDFDQVRVFTWSTQRHRYETAYRLHPIQGFLPLKLTSEPAPERKLSEKELARQAKLASQKSGSQNKSTPPEQSSGPQTAPVFSFQIADGTDMAVDPETGMSRPAKLRTIRMQMVDTRVSRIGPDLAPIQLTKLPIDKSKEKSKNSKQKKRR